MAEKIRFIGFDILRAYAIFGMYIVNFNLVFGDPQHTSWLGQFLNLFSGNSSTIFVILAGMGLTLTSEKSIYTSQQEQFKQRTIIQKKAGFLFVLGLLLSTWWPADILHFYGFYMFIASFFLFLDKKYYMYGAIFFSIVFHLLLILIPYETGWNFDTLTYVDHWTFVGFIRNSLYNGWNSVFPWMSYFMIGMYLGKLDWTKFFIQKKVFLIGLILYLAVQLALCIPQDAIGIAAYTFLNADYLPPVLPFLISTTGFSLLLISAFMYINRFIIPNTFVNCLAKTGQMTLTHYISHLTLGIILFSFLVNTEESIQALKLSGSLSPAMILFLSSAYFIGSYYFSKIWTKKFRNGPFELLLRRASN
ncbi:DUF418 domain-containing protein [Sphingobacterium sp.]|uniref:DUF418 domain-containing protein n=1 Tax=Sphingobacterium sp. TaxID=341027 RepID=UPI0028AFAC88|nr:DUF418 domain-containing protein [Sphingobacterium sp.]